MKRLLVMLMLAGVICTGCSKNTKEADRSETIKAQSISQHEQKAKDQVMSVKKEREKAEEVMTEAIDITPKEVIKDIESYEITIPDSLSPAQEENSVAYSYDDKEYGKASVLYLNGKNGQTEEEFNAFVKDIFEQTAQASDDGYNLYGYERQEPIGSSEERLAKASSRLEYEDMMSEMFLYEDATLNTNKNSTIIRY